MPKQLKQLRNRPRLIVGTPGRVNDHLSRGTLRLDKTNFLVLDETDRMLDMGFGIQLEQIAKFLPSERQTLMFSATMPHNIMSLSEKYLYEPERISIGATSAPATNVTQEEIHVKESEKYSRLLNELNEREGSVIIFVKTKRSADMLADKLCAANQNADALHGDLQQNKRERVVKAFRNQRYRILVATDIAARGLDIPHIAHVINYDLPQCPEDYVHRIGRTARAGAEGAAVNFITSSDYGKWNAIQRLINPNFVPEKGSNRNNQGQNSNRRSGGGKPRNGNGGRNSKGFAPRSNNSEFRGDSRRSPSQAGSSNSSRDFKPRPPRDSNAFDENNAVRFDDKPKKVSFSITPKRFVSGTPQRPQRSRHAA
jgi:superfamily II DNA/RNA helicase